MKRKAQKKYVEQEIDMMAPINLETIGTADDPCFGKFFDPSAEECGRCGDSELCSIACSQLLHKKRKVLEQKQPFKDIDEVEIDYVGLYKGIKIVMERYPDGLLLSRLKKRVVKRLGITYNDFDLNFNILKKKNSFANNFIYKNKFIKLK